MTFLFDLAQNSLPDIISSLPMSVLKKFLTKIRLQVKL